jgi:hypothetical protein
MLKKKKKKVFAHYELKQKEEMLVNLKDPEKASFKF